MSGRRRPGRLSLRARLMLISMALLTVGLVVSDVVVVSAVRAQLLYRVDLQLEPVAVLAARLPPGILDGIAGVRSPAISALTADAYAVYLRRDGGVDRIIRTEAAVARPGPDLPRLDTVAVAMRGDAGFTVPGSGGSPPWRAMVRARADGLGGSVVVAVPLDAVVATLGRVELIAVLASLALLGLLAAAGWLAIRGGLRPLRRVEHVASAIAAGDLSRRIPELAGPRTEVGRLSDALNGMLGQLERAFAARAESEARMRRFVADVSHELRTPLFGIKGTTELYGMGALAGPGDVERAMHRIDTEAGRLARLVEDLLLLARLDEADPAGTPALSPTPMDLRTLAADARHDLRALDPSRPVRLTGPESGPATSAPVLGDEARLRQVVANLVGNVVTHTPAGSAVRLGVGTVGAEAVLEVQDEGPGMSAEQAARAFDRFYRADTSRTRPGGGAGLGLAIVRSLVAAHGGRVELRTAPGAGATFRVVLPAAAPEPPAPPDAAPTGGISPDD